MTARIMIVATEQVSKRFFEQARRMTRKRREGEREGEKEAKL